MKHSLLRTTLLCGGLALGCKDESATSNVREAREKAAEKQADLFAAQRDVQAAQAELTRARGAFVVASSRRLAELDTRILELRRAKDSQVDWTEVSRLREAADRLRAEAGNSARVFALSVQDEFEQLARDIEARLAN